MKTRNSNAKFQSSSISYSDKQKAVLASKNSTLFANDEDDESGGGNSKGKLGNYKLEKLRNVIAKGTFKANHFGKFLNQHGLDASSLKESELSKESAEIAEKAAVEDKVSKVSEDTQKSRDIAAAKAETKGLDKQHHADESQAVRYGLFNENSGHADNQGAVIQSSTGLSAEKRGLEALQGSGIAGSVTNSSGAYLGKSLGGITPGGAIGRYNMLNNATQKTASSHGQAAVKTETSSQRAGVEQKPGARR